MHRNLLRILYLQIRDDAATRQEERQEFLTYGQLEPHQLTVLNVFDTPHFAASCVDPFDALFVGGSSDASVIHPDRYPFVHDAKALMLYCIQHTVPVFASCFGFQLAVEALGARVIEDSEHMEMGVYPIQLTAAAAEDRLMHDLPSPFLAISGHKERALTLPENAISLAYSELCPYHAFKVQDKPFYGFQFHPEMNPQDLETRIRRYQARYLQDHNHLQTVLNTLQETPHSNQLITRFIDRILLAEPEFTRS